MTINNKVLKKLDVFMLNASIQAEQSVAIFPGSMLFTLKATHGMPLDFAIDHILGHNKNNARFIIEWPSFIEEARRNKRWDFQTYDDIQHALQDSHSYTKEQQQEIIDRFKVYVVKYPIQDWLLKPNPQ